MEQLREILKAKFDADLSVNFKSGAYYDTTMDFVEYIKYDTITVSERVDGVLTLLQDARSREIMGFRLKGFRFVFNQIKYLLELRDTQFLPLVAAIEKAFTIEGTGIVDSANRVKRYREALKLASNDGVFIDPVQLRLAS